MLVPVIHFFEDVALVFLEFTDRIGLNLLDLVTLTLQLCVELIYKVSLLLKTLFLFLEDSLFDFGGFFCEILKDFTLFLHSCILFSLQIGKVFVHLSADWVKLVVQ